MAFSETAQPRIVKPESKRKEVESRNYAHIMVKTAGGERETEIKKKKREREREKGGKDNYKDNRKKKSSW